MNQNLEKLEKLLRNHNWYHLLSHAPDVQQKGLLEKQEIQSVIGQLKQEGLEKDALKLWIRWCPYDDGK